MATTLSDFIVEALSAVNGQPAGALDEGTIRTIANETVSKWQSSHARGGSTTVIPIDPAEPDIFTSPTVEPPTMAPEELP